MGIERFVALYEACGGEAASDAADVFIAAVGNGTQGRAFALAEKLRDGLPGLKVEMNLGAGSFKSQMKRADKSQAEYALVIGEQELADNTVGLKPLRSREEQETVTMDEVVTALANKVSG